MKNWKNSESNTPEPPLQGGDYFLPPSHTNFCRRPWWKFELRPEGRGGREKYWGPPENVVAQGPP